MPDLVVIKTFKGVYLARPTDIKGKGVDQLRIFLKLAPSATHKPQPDEIPDQAKLCAHAREGMQKAAEILLKRG